MLRIALFLQGGTDQRDGLNEGQKLFDSDGRSNPTPKRVAILITDGAPNQEGANWSTISQAATDLKNKYGEDSVELYTIGLSMDLVGDNNRNGLRSIATGGASATGADKHWFEANNGAALVEALKTIIGRVVNEASLKGDITDVIDEAFYPVAKDGTPLQKDMMINLDGELITQVPADGKYSVITFDGTNYGVKWSDQVVAYTDGPNPTWEGKFYIKAKEDFLGGNTVNTNKDKDGNDNPLTVFEPKKYIVDGNEYDLLEGDDEKLKRTFETPYVNVDELTFTEIDTDWTVYLGTEVTPIEQLKELLKAVKVKEVVSQSTGHMITNKDAMLGSSKTDDSETFPLSECIGNLTDADWEKLVGVEDEFGNVVQEPVVLDYSKYGQENKGKIVISLTKSGAYSDFNSHPTEETGQAVEKYVLTVSHIPDPPDTEKNYHTTIGGTPGADTNRMRSTNTHNINVYAKRLSIVKVDQSDNPVTGAAEFALFRKATASDHESDYAENVPAVLPTNQNYVLIGTYTTENGVAITDNLSKLYEYYLVETSAPAGYTQLPGYCRPYVDTEGRSIYTTILEDPARTSTQKWNPWVLSGWVENSTIRVDGIGDDMAGYVTYGQGAGVPFTYDTEVSAVKWKIRNDSGAVLPHTGGPGTDLLALLGSTFVVLAGVTLAFTRKRHRSAA